MRPQPRKPRKITYERSTLPVDHSSAAACLDELTGGIFHDSTREPEEIAESLCLTPSDMQDCADY